ncbi:MAG: 4Fe-4S binding protein [Deltaproteobacteria bacterium]|nr:4Fe-4S binding protein [Deltaproteobacteria bacterium]
MHTVALDTPGEAYLLIGNEAIARGALEAGLDFSAAYPGNPSSEIMETLAAVAKDLKFYAEWSVNEKVALESAAAASFAGLRAMTAMKQNGVNVVSDFMTNLTLTGVKRGLVLVTCDDPGGISSTNEEDARLYARIADIPLMEPSSPQEALEMTRFAFELSEEIGALCIIRSTSRISHSRGRVVFGQFSEWGRRPHVDTSVSMNTFPVLPKHKAALGKLDKAQEIFEESPFNAYTGPDAPELMVITCGTGYLYVQEALALLDLNKRVGVAKIGTTWPLPDKWVQERLKQSGKILIIEEVQPFLEDNVKSIYAQHVSSIGLKTFYGKASGHIPRIGELNPDVIMKALASILEIDVSLRDEGYAEKAKKVVDELVPPRELGFCPGCPHRASYWSIKNALKWDDRDGFVSGDIGCYTMGIWPTGFNQVNSVHAMGSGVGMSSGYGKLDQQGLEQPIISVVGDSTFFHAGLPPLVNAIYNQSSFLLIILDNSATAMTGFQPHPGTGINATGDVATTVDIESVCRSMGTDVTVLDPYDLEDSSKTIYSLLQQSDGVRVIIMRRKCALVQRREGGFPYEMDVKEEACMGENCGCNRYCTRVFRCPGLIWDTKAKKTRIDPVICVGCGVCSDVCPEGAIIRKEVSHG